MMNPTRAFLFTFTAGLALLFSGHGLVSVVLADPPPETTPADVANMTGRFSAA